MNSLSELLEQLDVSRGYLLGDIERYLVTSLFSPEARAMIERNLSDYNDEQLVRLYFAVKKNQANKIESGFNYNAGDIQKKLKQMGL